jgi:UDP-N-acetyl-D-glucosamine dehydrogenase
MLIVLESTTYPGTTREVMVPKLTHGKYELGKDVFVAFSPERVDPGNKKFHTRNTPKVIGGATPACLSVAKALYGTVIDTLIPVSSTDAAEMVKLLENTFRAVNIGLVNEVALMSRRLGVDVWEVIRAAASKPFGFMPFFPGPGLGGHCIPIDPLYLSWRMRSLKYQARFIELADTINSSMPGEVVLLVQEALNRNKKAVNGSKILVAGVAYKRDVSDYRESPAFDVIHGLRTLGAELDYLDAHVPEVDEHGMEMRSVASSVSFADYDAVVIVTDHTGVDYARMLREAPVLVDTRDALRNVEGDHRKVLRL